MPLSPELDSVTQRAADAALVWAGFSPRQRATALVAVADAIESASSELIAVAREETGLAEARLAGELKRTAVQLRLFSDVVIDGGYLDVRIDEADDSFVLGVRPDLRRYLVPLGPVLNFAASNFPFAFSVVGGDTASALAAGNSVIVKAHSGHPGLSARIADIASKALRDAGAPDGLLQLVTGQEAGVTVLKDPRIAAASFTGSITVGRMLADVAAARPVPIPFYGELGSVNPAFVTRAALAEKADGIADGFVASVSGSAGQLCTKPGFLFVPAGSDFGDAVAARAVDVPEQRMLYPGVASGYMDRRETILGAQGVAALADGTFRSDDDGQGWVTPTFVRVSLPDLVAQQDRLRDEAFGPLAIVVEYEDDNQLIPVAEQLFDGNLTGTVHLATGEDSATLRSLVQWLTGHVGRVLFNGWPTGVAVTPAMQHGGPYPATTTDTGTSVGTAAISRFLRAVSYQDAPQSLLPAPLRDDNPWGVPQHRSPAGQSTSWGSAVSTEQMSGA